MVRAAEIVGVLANLVYTWMYLQGEVPFAYAWAAIGSIALMWACAKRSLLAESGLHLFYLLMAGVGAWVALEWKALGTASWEWHAMGIGLGFMAWGALIQPLKAKGSAMPALDSFTTVFSVLATWWMVHLDDLNWWYWLVIDAASIYLYAKRGMPWGAFLFFVYELMAIDGCFQAISWF